MSVVVEDGRTAKLQLSKGAPKGCLWNDPGKIAMKICRR